jgi:glycosyltransferase involved in cell wall biosynthesis
MKKLRVAFIVDAWFPFVGGGQIYAQELKKQLEDHYDCQILIFAPPKADIFIRALWTFILPFIIFRQHRKKHFEVIHSQGYHSGLSGKIAQLLIHRPLVHTVHGSNLTQKQVQSVKAKLEKWLLTQINYDAIISVTHAFLGQPHHGKSAVYIPNGVDTKVFKPLKNTERPIDLLWIGRNDWTKGFDLWSQVLKILEPLGLTSKTILQGNFPPQEMAAIYSQSRILVITSRSEGFPLVLLEAWASGLAIISTKVGEIPYILEDANTGLLISTDANDIANAIQKLLFSPQLVTTLADQGLQKVKATYTWKHVAEQTLAVYKQVILNK